MTRQQQEKKKNSPKVPAYIVTFSDMVTLLLTFFVMLLSLSKIQDPELYDIGRDSFLESIGKFGLGMLYGKKASLDFGEEKVKYFVDEPDELPEVRNIDVKEEVLRRIFKKISQSMRSTPSQLVAEKASFSITNISFSIGSAQLNELAKIFLKQFVMDLQQNADFEKIKLYVLGLASGEETEKKQWILSAIRAQAVADFIKNILPSHVRFPVHSWGAGPGGDWASKNSLASEQSQILIAVLRPD